MRVKLFVATLALWSAAAFALPSFNDVESAVNAGNYPQAEQMMQEVVAAKPGSAKAHYVYAEILAHDAKFDQAAREAAQAQQIDPALSFTDPNKFRDFQRLLQREQAGEHRGAQAGYGGGYAPAHAQPSGVPGWMWGVGFAVLAFILWRAVARRSAMMGGPVYGTGPATYGPGGVGGPYGGPGGQYGPVGPMGGTGSSLLGTGLAAAGGVAGGMLLEKYLEGQHGGQGGYAGPVPGSFDDGGAQAAGELENRQIDFGNGSDWGGGDGGGGGGADFSPSGDDSGGGW